MLTILYSGGGLEQRLAQARTHQTKSSFILNGQTDSLTIEAVRDFQQQLSLTLGEGTAALILEAQTLSLPAQHALLKTIEEPQTNLQLVITVDRPPSLLPTILSRCHTIRLPSPHTDLDPETIRQLKSLLNQIARSNTGELITLSGQLIKNNPQTLIDQLLTFTHQLFHDQPSPKRARILHLINQTAADFRFNLNPNLTLEHFLVELQRLML